MNKEDKVFTLHYDPIVQELANLSNEIQDEKLKKRVDDIIDLRYRRDAYGTDFNTPASPILQELLHETMTKDWDSVLERNEITYKASPHTMSGFWAGE